jgi:hypothetical protein
MGITSKKLMVVNTTHTGYPGCVKREKGRCKIVVKCQPRKLRSGRSIR